MAVKCLNCGNTIGTWQELTTLAAAAVKGVWDFMTGNAEAILVLIRKFMGDGGAVAGITAGPLNVNHLPCPHCGAKGRWLDL